MKIYHIVAMSENGIIGDNGDIPWKNKHDMRRFKELTMGHAVLMGRKTWESIPESYKPLEGRYNMILTRQDGYGEEHREHDDVDVFDNIESAIHFSQKLNKYNELYIMGGGEVYRQTLDIVDEIRMTVIEEEMNGDTSYPDIREDDAIWNRSYQEQHDGYRFVDLVRQVPLYLMDK